MFTGIGVCMLFDFIHYRGYDLLRASVSEYSEIIYRRAYDLYCHLIFIVDSYIIGVRFIIDIYCEIT